MKGDYLYIGIGMNYVRTGMCVVCSGEYSNNQVSYLFGLPISHHNL